MDQSSSLIVPDAGVDEPAWARRAVTVPVFALLALVGGALPSFSLLANVYVVLLGGTMTWIGMTRKRRRRPVPSRVDRGVLWWLPPLTLFVVVELVTFASGHGADFPTLSLLADPLLDGYLPRAGLYFGWLTAFWGLCCR